MGGRERGREGGRMGGRMGDEGWKGGRKRATVKWIILSGAHFHENCDKAFKINLKIMTCYALYSYYHYNLAVGSIFQINK